MKQSGVCPKCESAEIVADVTAIDRGESYIEWEMALAVYRSPDALLFKGKSASTVSAWVCGACGYVEFYADEPNKLQPPPA